MNTRLPVAPGWSAAVLALAGAAALLGGCHDNISAAAAGDAQVCYRFTPGRPARTALVSAPDENLETCAMHLEGWRLIHGLAAVNGTYQGRYIFTSAQDISSSMGPHDIRYRVYTPGQHADLDQKLQILIGQSGAQAGPRTGTGNAEANAQDDAAR